MELTHFFIGVFLLLVLSIAINIIQKVIKKSRLKRSGIYDIDKMDGLVFEQYLGTLLRTHGYKVSVTKGSGDYGADLILHSNDKKIVVQAKRYKDNVGLKAVQEVYAAARYYKANECWVITNSYYTQQAKNLAKVCEVKLIDRESLIKMIEKNKDKKK